MKRSARRVARVLLAATVLIVAAACGVPRLMRWHAERSKAGRLEQYRQIIRRHADANDLPTELVETIILAESSGDRRAVSPKNARGLMQIMPITEREVLRRKGLDKGDLFDPDYNVRLGTTYLRMLLDRFEDDLYLALAAYHMGPTRLDRLRRAHQGLSPRQLVDRHAPRSTARYCRNILSARRRPG